MKEYVEQRNGGYYVAGTRVSLDSVVYGFLQGDSAETIQHSFPALTLEQVYGALTFYLANSPSVNKYLERKKQHFDTLAAEARAKDPVFYARLAALRK